MDNPELKPCPFCGSNNAKAYFKPKYNYHGVRCGACPAAGPPEKTIEGGIKAWNSQSNAAELAMRDRALEVLSAEVANCLCGCPGGAWNNCPHETEIAHLGDEYDGFRCERRPEDCWLAYAMERAKEKS